VAGPRILIVNDDGVDAPGIAVMREIAAAISDDVWVVAPDGNQSGAAHRFTFGRELSLDQRDRHVFAVVGGSPADCVVVGFTHVLKDRAPDIVLSGVNNGQNLGDIVNCSGTVAGAREGALHGALGIAMSQGVDYEHGDGGSGWTTSLAFGARVVEGLFREARGTDAYFNVNFPFCELDEVTGVEVVPTQRFARSPMAYYPSDNAGKFFIAIPSTPRPLDPARDFHRLNHGNAVTVTPLLLQQSDMRLVEGLSGKF
jgi:5'-nucleotidase